MPVKRHRRARLVLGLLVGAGGAAVAVSTIGGVAAADGACTTFSAVGAADGVRTFSSAPGFLLTDVDGEGPAAQAQVDSVAGSNGFAGAPYSGAVTGNAGAANVDANQVPIFAISSYPSHPNASTSTPAVTVQASSEPQTSTAKAVAGGPSSSQSTSGQTQATASSTCKADGTINATSANSAQVMDFGGILRIASVRSQAAATVTPTGEVKLDGTISVEGVTVLGQTVGVNDRGIVVGQSPTPLPTNPLVNALQAAGITVRVIGVDKNQAQGQVLAPSLEVTVRRAVSGVGTGPVTTTYTYGRAYARASNVPGGAPGAPAGAGSTNAEISSPASDVPSAPSSASGAQPSSSPATPATPSPAPLAASAPPARALAVPTARGRALASVRLANASTASVYPALVIGAVVLAAAWLVFRKLGVKLLWT